tara:strand:+ start:432 stop:695 length:264 start_codon:yes stop_codon:yes gene_type:complete
MSDNKEKLKNKIIYRASYRGTKEMDMLMLGFVQSIFKKQNDYDLHMLLEFVDMDDETLMSIKNKESLINFRDAGMLNLVKKFQDFKI